MTATLASGFRRRPLLACAIYVGAAIVLREGVRAGEPDGWTESNMPRTSCDETLSDGPPD
jgi:hypothetical protein